MERVNPEPIMASRDKIWEFAENVATKLSFSSGAPIEPFVFHLGGRIVYKNAISGAPAPESIEIRTRNDFTIYLPTLTSPARDRFTIAHELGHLFLHYLAAMKRNKDIIMVAYRWVDANDPQQQRAEWEANWFAAAFLMPQEKFKSAFDAKDINDVAQLFAVTVHAANVRAKSLGLVR